MNNRQKYRRFVCFLLVLGIIGLGYCGWAAAGNRIPDTIMVSEKNEIPEFFHGLAESLVEKEIRNVSYKYDAKEASTGEYNGLSQRETDTYEVSYSLFGKIPLKTVSVSVVPRQEVYLGGIPIGIYLETNGVFVVDTGDVTGADGKLCCPAENIVKSGDYIQAVNGQSVSTKEELIACIGDCGGGDVVLDIDRAGELINLKVKPVQDGQGVYRAGIWVRNDTQGIGTLTYVDQNGRFGALGHGISDVDTGELLEVRGGTLYDADVVSIVKGKQGSPGEVSGIIRYSEGYKIGEIMENRRDGIYGTVSSLAALTRDMQLYSVAHRQEVEPGEASILCSVDGSLREYQVEIREVRMNGSDVNKGLVIEVTDPELLEMTGGIIQGMSGSPIIQKGRLVGAVTHVFVNDPTKGYGIFIENMLEH